MQKHSCVSLCAKETKSDNEKRVRDVQRGKWQNKTRIKKNTGCVGWEIQRATKKAQFMQIYEKVLLQPALSISLHRYLYVAGLASSDHQIGWWGRVRSWIESMQHCVHDGRTQLSEVWL